MYADGLATLADDGLATLANDKLAMPADNGPAKLAHHGQVKFTYRTPASLQCKGSTPTTRQQPTIRIKDPPQKD